MSAKATADTRTFDIIPPPHIMGVVSDGFKAFPKAVSEHVYNGIDHGAKAVMITFWRKATVLCMDVSDDGEGPNEERQRAILTPFDSTSRGDTKKRGSKGSGRLGAFNHTARLTYVGKTAADTHLWRTSFTKNEFYQNFIARKGSWDRLQKTPTNCMIRTSGLVVTFEGLGQGDGVSLQEDRSCTRLVAELASYMDVFTARKVTIVDELGNSHKLAEPPLIGTRVRLTRPKAISGVGTITYELAVADRGKTNKPVEIGALGQGTLWQQFASAVCARPSLEALILPLSKVLRDPRIGGRIEIPEFNMYGVNTRQGFSDDLYNEEDKLRGLITWLRRNLLPELEELLGHGQNETTQNADDVIIADVVKSIHDVTGLRPKKDMIVEDADTETTPDEVVPTWQVPRAQIALEPGMSYPISIKNADPKATYDWDDTRSGGHLSAKTGVDIVYTAGTELGYFEIVVSNRGSNDAKQTVGVVIMEELPFCFATAGITMGHGQQRNLRLINLHHTSGEFEIKIDNPQLGGLEEPKTTEDGREVHIKFVSNSEDGVVVIEAFDKKNATRFCAICNIHIREQQHKPDDDDDPKDSTSQQEDIERVVDNFVILYRDENGVEYRFTLMGLEIPDDWSKASYLAPDGSMPRGDITINVAHPVYMQASTPAEKRLVILQQIALRISEAVDPHKNIKDGQELAMRIFCELTVKNKKN
ncbi:MAG: ATP-binding protein [Patescibacteria group bacterium]